MKKKTENQIQNTLKKQYNKPALKKLGSLKELTKGAASGMNDSGGSQNGAMSGM